MWKMRRDRFGAGASRRVPASPGPLGEGTGWKRAVLAFVAAGGYSLVVLFGSIEQAAYLNRVIQLMAGDDCQPSGASSPPRPPKQ